MCGDGQGRHFGERKSSEQRLMALAGLSVVWGWGGAGADDLHSFGVST